MDKHELLNRFCELRYERVRAICAMVLSFLLVAGTRLASLYLHWEGIHSPLFHVLTMLNVIFLIAFVIAIVRGSRILCAYRDFCHTHQDLIHFYNQTRRKIRSSSEELF